jgi:L-rhamnose mutarotase
MSIDKLCKYLNTNILSVFIVLFALLYGSCNSPVSVSKKLNNAYSKAFASIAEITVKDDTVTLFEICKQNNIPLSNIYRWNNHFVIYAYNKASLLSPNVIGQLNDIHNAKVKIYYAPFYDFERSRCNNQKVEKNRDNIILTANLVSDPKKQQEYLDYHRTQFQKWPEVSQGFCNANFQQLLVFKSGRQLMLVISIPKGESLDKLNPLTTKNNPRVDDWNNMMKKYQEGIEGTKKGETWVFFKNIDENKFKD